MAQSVPASQLTEEQRNILKQRGQYDINAYYNPEYPSSIDNLIRIYSENLATLTGSTATTPFSSRPGATSSITKPSGDSGASARGGKSPATW